MRLESYFKTLQIEDMCYNVLESADYKTYNYRLSHHGVAVFTPEELRKTMCLEGEDYVLKGKGLTTIIVCCYQLSLRSQHPFDVTSHRENTRKDGHLTAKVLCDCRERGLTPCSKQNW